jgi:hypothetical protein
MTAVEEKGVVLAREIKNKTIKTGDKTVKTGKLKIGEIGIEISKKSPLKIKSEIKSPKLTVRGEMKRQRLTLLN